MSQERSKYLSYLLRHKPEVARLTLDKEGWCSIEQLLSNTDFTYDELVEIVGSDAKGRYAVAPEFGTVVGLKYELIRANQGHSTSAVKLNYKIAIPPPVLYHGTTAVAQILKEGLKPMSRHHVHMSTDLNTALSVGGRRKGVVTIFTIDTAAMLKDGYKFELSDNNVWLIAHVPPKYLMEMK